MCFSFCCVADCTVRSASDKMLTEAIFVLTLAPSSSIGCCNEWFVFVVCAHNMNGTVNPPAPVWNFDLPSQQLNIEISQCRFSIWTSIPRFEKWLLSVLVSWWNILIFLEMGFHLKFYLHHILNQSFLWIIKMCLLFIHERSVFSETSYALKTISWSHLVLVHIEKKNSLGDEMFIFTATINMAWDCFGLVDNDST